MEDDDDRKDAEGRRETYAHPIIKKKYTTMTVGSNNTVDNQSKRIWVFSTIEYWKCIIL